MAQSGTVDLAKARRALVGCAARMAPEIALRTAVTLDGGDAVECRGTVPKDCANITDSCRCNRPSIGDGICSTPLLLVRIGVMSFRRLMRIEHPNWLVLGERTSWTKEVEERVTRHRK